MRLLGVPLLIIRGWLTVYLVILALVSFIIWGWLLLWLGRGLLTGDWSQTPPFQ